ncbi:MAG: NUDIX hydrolase [Pirellulaceae bacterium]|nr:NUDIX hydrolase [Pirellulaceae bacterium]
MKPTNESKPEILAETNYLQLVQHGHWTYARRPNSIGAVGVVAVTDDRHLVLIEQYRIPVAGPVIELPAGLVGDDPAHRKESWEEAAGRELLEETGYEAGRLQLLVDGVSSAGLTDEGVHLMRASQLQRRHAGGGVENESITVHTIPLTEVPSWLQTERERGVQVDFKVYAGLYFLNLEHQS